MGVKYRVSYRNYFDRLCTVDILHDDYAGDIIPIRGTGDAACIIQRECSDDPYEPIINTKATISVEQEESYPLDILELQEASSMEFKVEFYIEGQLKFKGYLIPDGIQQSFTAAPFSLTLNATDGLMLLEGIPYTHNNLPGGRIPLNFFKQILFSESNLGIELPIYWVNDMTNDAYPGEDVYIGSVQWSPRGEGFTDYNGNYKSCMYILEGFLRSMQSRIVQSEGEWHLWRINDVATGILNVNWDSDIPYPPVNVLKTIGGDDSYDYRFIEENAILMVNPGVKTVITTYEQDQRDNILPNGNMDIVDGVFNSPIYWNAAGAAVESVGSLSDAAGSAVKISNPIPTTGKVFQLIAGYLPIDTDVLYSYINFGFKFSIINGAVTDSDGFIVWDSTPFEVTVRYDAGGVEYYLNEFGFWTTTSTSITITIAALKLGDVAQVDFNSKQDIIMPLPTDIPIERQNEPKIYVGFQIPAGRVVVYDDIYINVGSNNDVYESEYTDSKNTGKDEINLKISSSHNGFYVSNFMTEFSNSGLEKFFSDPKISGVTLTEMTSHAILRNKYKSSLVMDLSMYAENYKYTEIYTIQTLGDKKFLPLKSSWNTETNTINLTLVEIRNDGTAITTKHYGKNDQTKLSN